ncbi:MAG TPA: hypothetical protein VJI46_04175 [Candidatus Nanoarchaeia archaeon]|nr:hypothetical protein [Candidatus Nanoarchaeia archaeon]
MDEVPYIGKQKRDYRLGKGLLIGGTALAIIGAIAYHDLKKGYDSENAGSSSVIIREAHEYREKSLDERLRDALNELNSNPEGMERNYGLLAETVEGRLEGHPEYANRLIVSSLSVLKDNISPEAYVAMFEEIKKKVEENPELMDHFGENANSYMEKKITDKLYGKMGNALRDSATRLKEKGRNLLDALTKPREAK